MYPANAESYEVLQGVDWPRMDLQQARGALASVQAAMTPADETSLASLLYELWISTIKQNTAEEDQTAIATVYTRELLTWPGDIAREALRRAKRQCRFWPPLADLRKECTSLARRRVWLLGSLEDRIAQLQRPPGPSTELRAMPGSAKATARAAEGHVSWAPGAGNVERLAKHLDITREQAWRRVLAATPEEERDFKNAVRRLAAQERQQAVKGKDPK
jgi:hypothetical protein